MERILNHLRASRSRSYYQRLDKEIELKALLEELTLSDVPKRATVADINARIGVERSSVMKLIILKMDNTTFDVSISNTATVRDLKAAIQKKVDFTEKSRLMHRHISWTHVWGNFCLIYNHEKLLNDDATLREFSMKNNDQLEFTQHVEAERHSRSKKRRFFYGLRKSMSVHCCSTVDWHTFWKYPGEGKWYLLWTVTLAQQSPFRYFSLRQIDGRQSLPTGDNSHGTGVIKQLASSSSQWCWRLESALVAAVKLPQKWNEDFLLLFGASSGLERASRVGTELSAVRKNVSKGSSIAAEYLHPRRLDYQCCTANLQRLVGSHQKRVQCLPPANRTAYGVLPEINVHHYQPFRTPAVPRFRGLHS
ncbi:hypothetical protein R1flu_003434 [Riccia fluitans]|uniref:SNRNP25 ubiquitin-like domain-containing protein n=1 Tax=Riccia fluitans TaxID=41844 RepID=A0ABD1Y9Z2_9MARC